MGGRREREREREREKGEGRSLFITAAHFVPRAKIIRRSDGAPVVLSMEFRFLGERLRNRFAIPRRGDGGRDGRIENGEWNKTSSARGKGMHAL